MFGFRRSSMKNYKKTLKYVNWMREEWGVPALIGLPKGVATARDCPMARAFSDIGYDVSVSHTSMLIKTGQVGRTIINIPFPKYVTEFIKHFDSNGSTHPLRVPSMAHLEDLSKLYVKKAGVDVESDKPEQVAEDLLLLV